MSELTKEHFAQHMKRMDKRFDGVEKNIKGVEKKIEVVETRVEGIEKKIDGVEKRIETEIAGLAKMVADGFADQQKRLDVRDKVENMDERIKRIETALNIAA
jgi:archaellum component FlaC